ncbi:hypothetical protein PAPHI01_0253 [Pancytospora philotis]|nr:hypothetical protein PAPHI01_0253 [Pancytospora philotis]
MRGRQLWCYLFALSQVRSGCATMQTNDSSSVSVKSDGQGYQSLPKIYMRKFRELSHPKDALYEHCVEINALRPPIERLESPKRFAKVKGQQLGSKQRFIQLTILSHSDPLGFITRLVNERGYGTLEALGEFFCSANAARRGLCADSTLDSASELVRMRININVDGPYELIRSYLLREIGLVVTRDFSAFIANLPQRHNPDDFFLYMLRKSSARAPVLHGLYDQILEYLIEEEILIESGDLVSLGFVRSLLEKPKLMERFGSRIFRRITLENIVSIRGPVLHGYLSITTFFIASADEIFRYIASSDSKKISPYFVANYMDHYLGIYSWHELPLLAAALKGYYSNALHGRERLEVTHADSSLVYSLMSGPICRMLDNRSLLSASMDALPMYIYTFIAELPIGTSVEVLDIALTKKDRKLMAYIKFYRFAAYVVWEAMHV